MSNVVYKGKGQYLCMDYTDTASCHGAHKRLRETAPFPGNRSSNPRTVCWQKAGQLGSPSFALTQPLLQQQIVLWPTFSDRSKRSCWSLSLLKSFFIVRLELLFSLSVMSNSLQAHGLQHTRLPSSSLSPRVCSNSCSSSWWCHPTVLSSVVPFSSCPQSFPALGSFPVS